MVVAESEPGPKFSEAPFGGLHYFSKQLLKKWEMENTKNPGRERCAEIRSGCRGVRKKMGRSFQDICLVSTSITLDVRVPRRIGGRGWHGETAGQR